VNGISGLVSLSKYLILQFLDVRHTNPSFIPQHSLVIFRKYGRLLFLDITRYLLDLLIFQLTFLNILEWSRIYFHLHDFRVTDDPKVDLVELFTQLGWHLLYYQSAQMRPSTPSIDYHIHSSGVIVDSRIVILDKN
jgi:hypothetical protein